VSVATRAHPEGVRALAFSDPDGEVWGAAWVPPSSPVTATVSAGAASSTVSAALEGEEATESWQLQLEDGILRVEGLGDPVENGDRGPGGFDQLCQVSGSVVVGGDAREVSCLGWRGTRSPELLSGGVDAFRQVAAWIGPEDGFSLLALRPARAKGHDTEEVSAAVFAADEAKPVAEPRLSTTYDDSGEPMRAGVELWIQAGEDPDQQYPQRAVGERIQHSASWAVEGLAFTARPFYWHAGGREGPGIYLLGQRG